MFCNSTITDLFLFVFTQLILHYRQNQSFHSSQLILIFLFGSIRFITILENICISGIITNGRLYHDNQISKNLGLIHNAPMFDEKVSSYSFSFHFSYTCLFVNHLENDLFFQVCISLRGVFPLTYLFANRLHFLKKY